MPILRRRVNHRPTDPPPQLWYRAPTDDTRETRGASAFQEFLEHLAAHMLMALLAFVLGGLLWWFFSLLYRR